MVLRPGLEADAYPAAMLPGPVAVVPEEVDPAVVRHELPHAAVREGQKTLAGGRIVSASY